MRYVPGRTLEEVLNDRSPLESPRVLQMLKQLLDILEYAHSQGVVHRDLKPGNIIVVDEGQTSESLRLLDFGIAKILSGDETIHQVTMTEGPIGTPNYMAPEQVSGGTVDERTDLYALGVILYRMVSGKQPFDGRSWNEVATARLTEDPTPLPIPNSAPEGLPPLIEAMLNRAREERPGSEDVRRRLEQLESQLAQSGWRVGSGWIVPLAAASSAIALTWIGSQVWSTGNEAEATGHTLEKPREPSFSAAQPAPKGRTDPPLKPTGDKPQFNPPKNPSAGKEEAIAEPLAQQEPSLVLPQPKVEDTGEATPPPPRDSVHPILLLPIGPDQFICASQPTISIEVLVEDEHPALLWVDGREHPMQDDRDELDLALELGWNTIGIVAEDQDKNRSKEHILFIYRLPEFLSPPAKAQSVGWPELLHHTKTGMTLKRIPSGEFLMGAPERDARVPTNQRRQVSVTVVETFYLGVTEVSVGQFDLFCNESGTPAPRQRTWSTTEQHPVVDVSWREAAAFCHWAGLGLPTEIQWERAARCGTTSSYPWGDSPAGGKGENVFDRDGRAVLGHHGQSSFPFRDGFDFPVAVGTTTPNAWGFFDMIGNVAEWSRDLYEESSELGPQMPRTIRGGSFSDGPSQCRVYMRRPSNPDITHGYVGIRCAWAPELRPERSR